MFTFLRAIGLWPIEWSEAISLTGKASPFVGQVVDVALETAQAIVVLFTPDDIAHLQAEHAAGPDDPDTRPQGQARPNVLFEAGMAMGRNPDRTVLVELGQLRPFSNIAGRYVLKMDNSPQRRAELAQRLRGVGCDVKMAGQDWLTAGEFSIASPRTASPPGAPGAAGKRGPSRPGAAGAAGPSRAGGTGTGGAATTSREDDKDLLGPEAERIAGIIDAPLPRVLALTEIAATALGSDAARASRLLGAAERISRDISDRGQKAVAMREVARVMAGIEVADALQVARDIDLPFEQLQALGEIAVQISGRDVAMARRLLDEVTGRCREAGEVNFPRALAAVAIAYSSLDPDRAAQIARTIPASTAWTGRTEGDKARLAVARAMAAQYPQHARAIMNSIRPGYLWGIGAADVILDIADSPSTGRDDFMQLMAKAIAPRTFLARDNSPLLGRAAKLMASRDAMEAERMAHSIPDAKVEALALGHIAAEVAARDPGGAERLAGLIFDRPTRAAALRDIARVIFATDDVVAWRLVDQAERAAKDIPEHQRRAEALRGIAEVSAQHDPAHASRLIADAETIALSLDHATERYLMLGRIAETVASYDVVEAERIASAVADPQRRVRALLAIAGIASRSDPDGRLRLIADAEKIALGITAREDQDKALSMVITSMLHPERIPVDSAGRSLC
jgi:hypothetical protein